MKAKIVGTNYEGDEWEKGLSSYVSDELEGYVEVSIRNLCRAVGEIVALLAEKGIVTSIEDVDRIAGTPTFDAKTRQIVVE